MEYITKIIKLLHKIEISTKVKVLYSYDGGIKEIFQFLRQCKDERNTLFICGNGGSAGIAQHMTGDFLKNGGFRTFSMYGQPTITCISNDLSYEYVFCKQLELLAKKDDLLIAISSSGNSENIIKAVKTMKKIGGKVITFSGFKSDNKLKTLGDINVYVPVEHYGMVESIHNLILQQLVDIIVDEDGVAMGLDTDD